jgi:maltose/moltooligosaccharide transporter
LWVLDASINVAMEPFRAFVGDMLRKDQHTAGYALQTAFIGAGAVIGSIFPYSLSQLRVGRRSRRRANTVRYSFRIGGALLLLTVLWTVGNVRENSPDEMAAFSDRDAASAAHPHAGGARLRAASSGSLPVPP